MRLNPSIKQWLISAQALTWTHIADDEQGLSSLLSTRTRVAVERAVAASGDFLTADERARVGGGEEIKKRETSMPWQPTNSTRRG